MKQSLPITGAVICLMLGGMICCGQSPENDSVILLRTVNISSTRLHDNAVGLHVEKFDSLSLARSRTGMLSDLFVRQTPVIINTYGSGSLATMSLRGTSSNHTAFFWNGISISPPTTRLTDMALLPVIFFRNIEIQYGGASSVFGGGTIGGSVHLDNNFSFNDRKYLSFDLSAGSYGDYSGNGVVMLSSDKWITSTSFFYHQARNDFKFRNTAEENHPVERQQNARNEGAGIVQQISRALKGSNFLTVDIWAQSTGRDIPSPLNYPGGAASQKDQSLRTMMSWKNIRPRSTIRSTIAFFHDFLHYVENTDFYSVDSRITTDTWISQSEARKIISDRLSLNAGIDIRHETGRSGYYDGTKQQTQGACYLTLKYLIPDINWQSALIIRKGWTQDKTEPFTPSLGLEGPLWKMISAKISISRNFRQPTFNERYWNPGGNPDLLPEVSWNEESSFIFKWLQAGSRWHPALVFTAYNSTIDNWIIWLPTDETFTLWQPQNIQKVWARGLELNGHLTIEAGRVKVDFDAGYTLSRSTNQANIDVSFRKQLIYVPENIASASLSVTFIKSQVSYTHHYTDRRYVNSDNSQSLPPYNLGYVTLSHNFKVLGNDLSLQLDILNVWNTDYQAIQYYPMPGRSYRVSFVFTIH
jgi:vitamin B12 transporter